MIFGEFDDLSQGLFMAFRFECTFLFHECFKLFF